MKGMHILIIRLIGCLMILIASNGQLNAQRLQQGSFEPLLNVHAVSVQFDFSQTMVEGLPLNDFIQNIAISEGEQYVKDIDKDRNEIIGDFIEEFNDSNGPILLAVAKKVSSINLTVNVKGISRKGNKVDCDYIFSDSVENKNICTIVMVSQDGRVGSFTNLM